MFKMQLIRGTQQSPPLPRDSADKESMVVESEEISEIGQTRNVLLCSRAEHVNRGESFSTGKTEGFGKNQRCCFAKLAGKLRG